MNQIIVTGNLTKDPERYKTEKGTDLTKFSIAINDYDTTVFLNIITFKTLAENCAKFLNKGSKVLVAGRLTVNEYEKDDKHYRNPEIIAGQVEFLTPKGKNEDMSVNDMPFPEVAGKTTEKSSNPSEKKQVPSIVEDDLPF